MMFFLGLVILINDWLFWGGDTETDFFKFLKASSANIFFGLNSRRWTEKSNFTFSFLLRNKFMRIWLTYVIEIPTFNNILEFDNHQLFSNKPFIAFNASLILHDTLKSKISEKFFLVDFIWKLIRIQKKKLLITSIF